MSSIPPVLLAKAFSTKKTFSPLTPSPRNQLHLNTFIA